MAAVREELNTLKDEPDALGMAVYENGLTSYSSKDPGVDGEVITDAEVVMTAPTVREALDAFAEKMGYKNNPNVLGMVFYGSFLTGYSSKDSDVDVHIIMANTTKLVRGVTHILGFKIEYFEKPILDLYLTAENEINIQNNALLAMIGCGEIIFEQKGIVGALQDYIQIRYAKPLPVLEENEAKEMVCIIDNRVIRLQKMFEQDHEDFDHCYHVFLDKIMKFYHRLLGCPDIPPEKVRRIYTDAAYRKSFCKDYLPEEEFILMYLEAISCTGSKAQKMELFLRVYNFSRRNVNVDPNEYRIYIKSRNDPSNLNHK